MTETSRRTFLAMTGGGLAAGATLVATEADAVPSPLTETESADPVDDNSDLIVAYLQDPSTNRITVAVGDREFTFFDQGLTRKLTRLAQQGRS